MDIPTTKMIDHGTSSMIDHKQGEATKLGHKEGLKQQVMALLEEFELPGGLFPLEEVIEVQFVKETGYLRILQKKKVKHVFKMIRKNVSYGKEITGYISKNNIKMLKGVKAKEFLLWPPVDEIFVVGEATTGDIHFKSVAGITRISPVEAFAAGQ
ncbi:hypothetical protein LINPERPRIM_LOCUS24297 [Linum perenne]